MESGLCTSYEELASLKQNSSLWTAALCLLISAQAASSQNTATKMPFASEKSILEPTVFAPDTISTGDYEVVPQFSPDGKIFYFVKSTPDAIFWTIVFSRFENARWSAPAVAPFSGQYSDADEFITADGKQMFFISRRPVSPEVSPNAAGKLDIWMMDKIAGGAWSEPKNLGTPVNSEASEYFPTLTKDGTLYSVRDARAAKAALTCIARA